VLLGGRVDLLALLQKVLVRSRPAQNLACQVVVLRAVWCVFWNVLGPSSSDIALTDQLGGVSQGAAQLLEASSIPRFSGTTLGRRFISATKILKCQFSSLSDPQKLIKIEIF
jgi:hypothetical protein